MRTNISKGISLGYDIHTNRNLLYYDVDTYRIKLVSHVEFDEGMNDFPMANTPTNVQHLQRVDNGQLLTEEQKFVHASQFELYINPFTYHLPVILKFTPHYTYPTFCFTLQYEDLLKRASVKAIQPKSPSSKIFSNPRSTNNKQRGVFVTSIHGTRVFTSDDALKQISLLHMQGVLKLLLTFALEKKSSFKEGRKVTNEYGLFSPKTRWYEDSAIDQLITASTTTDTEGLKAKIVENEQAINDYSEGLHERIQYTICPT